MRTSCTISNIEVWCESTVFLWSDAAGYYLFHCSFVQLQFKGSYYSRATLILWKTLNINNGWIRHVRVWQWWLLDAVSSTHSLSVLLSAIGMTHTYNTNSPSTSVVTTVRNHLHTCALPCLLAVATIQGQHLFCSRASICAATIQGWWLFKGGIYSKKYGKSTLRYINNHRKNITKS